MPQLKLDGAVPLLRCEAPRSAGGPARGFRSRMSKEDALSRQKVRSHALPTGVPLRSLTEGWQAGYCPRSGEPDPRGPVEGENVYGNEGIAST